MTPRQTCPRPEGFGRNLRSKTRWFTGFCNSHQVSHFATFFIDARAEISVAESRYVVRNDTRPPRSPVARVARGALMFMVLGAVRAVGTLFGGALGPAGLLTGPRVFLLDVQVSTMILPQVHLRKPCYDFSFL